MIAFVLKILSQPEKHVDTLLLPLEEYLKQERYSKHSVIQTRLCRAALGNDAGIIGATFLE